MNPDGYVLVWKPEHRRANRNGYVLEHVLVMEGVLGRVVVRPEEVHHKDRDRANNSPDNLQLLPSKGEHKKLHAREAAARRAASL